MVQQDNANDNNGVNGSGGNSPWKIHISRVPTKFTEEIVHRILCEKLASHVQGGGGGEDQTKPSPIVVELVYPRNGSEGTNNGKCGGGDSGNAGESSEKTSNKADKQQGRRHQSESNTPAEREHRGFGFVAFASPELQQAALDLKYIKGGRKVTSKRLYTMYLRPYVDEFEEKKGSSNASETGEKGTGNHVDKDAGRNQCYLWSLYRCPYGNDCKFEHIGEGACVDVSTTSNSKNKVNKGKCFEYKKTGKCSRGDQCPFSHDFKSTTTTSESNENDLTKEHDDKKKDADAKNVEVKKPNERDCINWKTHGKCRKGEKCQYRHDPMLQQKALEKKKRRLQGQQLDKSKNIDDGTEKTKQPLSVRVFGLNYETTEDDVRNFFRECGTITDVTFPIFEDSGRSKGYCCLWFASPKASMKALELDGSELHGRWLRIQSGKMMRQWEDIHGGNDNKSSSNNGRSSNHSKRARHDK